MLIELIFIEAIYLQLDNTNRNKQKSYVIQIKIIVSVNNDIDAVYKWDRRV